MRIIGALVAGLAFTGTAQRLVTTIKTDSTMTTKVVARELENQVPQYCDTNTMDCLNGEIGSLVCEFIPPDDEAKIDKNTLIKDLVERTEDGLNIRYQLTDTINDFEDFCYLKLNQLLEDIDANPIMTHHKERKHQELNTRALSRKFKAFEKSTLIKYIRAGECQSERNEKALEKFKSNVDILKEQLDKKWTSAYVIQHYKTISSYANAAALMAEQLIDNFTKETSALNKLVNKTQAEMNQAEREILSDLQL